LKEKEACARGIFGAMVNLWSNVAPEQLWLGPFRAPTVEEFLGGFMEDPKIFRL